MKPRLLALLGAVLAITPLVLAQVQDGGTTIEGQGEVKLENRTFENLTIRDAGRVELKNVTVNGTLAIESSRNVFLTNLTIGRGLFLTDVTGFDVLRAHVTGFGLSGRQVGGIWITRSREFQCGQEVCAAVYLPSRLSQSTANWKIQGQDSYFHMTGARADTFCQIGGQVTEEGNTFNRRTCEAETTTASPTTGTTGPPTTTATPTTTTSSGPTALRSPTPEPGYQYVLKDAVMRDHVTIRGAGSIDIDNVTFERGLSIHESTYGHLKTIRATSLYLNQTWHSGLSNSVIDRLTITQSYDVLLEYSRATDGFECYDSQNLWLRNFQHAGNFVSRNCGIHYGDVSTQGPTTTPQSEGPERTPTTGTRYTEPTRSSPAPTDATVSVASSGLLFRQRAQIAADAGELQVDYRLSDAVVRIQGPGRDAVPLLGDFEKVIEYEETGEAEGFDLSDRVLREWRVADLPVRSISDLSRSGTQRRAAVEYEIPSGGILHLIFTAHPGGDRNKIDVEIEDYDYSTSRSRLALQMHLQGGNEWRLESGATEDRIVFPGRDMDTYFSWIRTAEADGRTFRVVSRVLHDPGLEEPTLFLSYERGQKIVHDPAVGLAPSSLANMVQPILGQAWVYLGALVVYLAVLVAGVRYTGRRPEI